MIIKKMLFDRIVAIKLQNIEIPTLPMTPIGWVSLLSYGTDPLSLVVGVVVWTKQIRCTAL